MNESEFDDLIDAYQCAQRGTLKERADARRALKQAFRELSALAPRADEFCSNLSKTPERADADTVGAKPQTDAEALYEAWTNAINTGTGMVRVEHVPREEFAATHASSVADAAGAMSDVRDFQRELANYFEDIGDPSGATMIRNFSDLSGYGASAAKQQSTPAYSAPFTTDVPHCCGDPDACNDPCIEVSDAAMERSVSAAERLMEKLGETTFVRKKGAGMTPEQRAALENVVLYYERNNIAEAECLRNLLAAGASERADAEKDAARSALERAAQACVDLIGGEKYNMFGKDLAEQCAESIRAILAANGEKK
jgi:hypothetical protein